MDVSERQRMDQDVLYFLGRLGGAVKMVLDNSCVVL